METKKVEYVDASILFDGCKEAWSIFCDSDPDCSWGDNEITLVNSKMIVKVLESYIEEEEENKSNRHVMIVLKRIKEADKDFYVNLEN